MRRNYSREQWLEWLAAQRDSGVPVSKFCVQKGIPEGSFYHWRKKLEKAAAPAAAGNLSKPLPTFVPVSVVGTGSLEIALPCGATIRLPDDEVLLGRVLKMLLDFGKQP